MFQDGGLKDQGGSKDPVSGNDVPSGSLKEEVRDDIDAKLSPGEFVFPADVVRFIGLEKLMLMRDKAKKGLSRMEEMGQMGNSEEATIDDDVPFGMEDLIIVAGSPDKEMSKGGVPKFVLGGVSQAGRGAQLLGIGGDNHGPLKYYDPKTNREITVSKIAGKFFPELPKGYIRKPEQVETKPRDIKSTTAKVESTLGSGERDGGSEISDSSVGGMTDTEKSDLQDQYDANPTLGSVQEFAGNIATDLTSTLGGTMVAGTQMLGGFLGKGVTGQGTLDKKDLQKAQAKMKAMTEIERGVQRDRDRMARATISRAEYAESVGGDPEDVGVPGTATVGGVEVDIATDKFGTTTITGVKDDFFSDLIGNIAVTDQELDFRELKAQYDDVQAAGPDSGQEMDQHSVGMDATGADDTGAEPDQQGQQDQDMADVATGGFIPKRLKKKQKKMKRGGLASR